ncbi:Caspase domain [Rhizoctonia solani]|uniref:Caspase domain n=1 Tax=Rhizoctonia solani TaxID=456999 RepID=A0A8H7M398_9AGAM|nr:Caspase domain [Rhizoctonia solani]
MAKTSLQGPISSSNIKSTPEAQETIITKPVGAKSPLHALVIDNSASDEQAKRVNIIKALRDLARPDNGINRDDPILIYYAGHGGEDTSKNTGVVPIPDFTIGVLIHRIAQEKGNNITLILDCCHSASGTRDEMDDARFIHKAYLPELPVSLDKAIIQDALSGSRDMVDPSSLRFSFESMDSHVLLAACGHGEVAFENKLEKRGYFSSALLELLRGAKIDSLTYRGCIQRLPPLRTRQPQNPVCEGRNIHRIFFNAKVQGAESSYILIKSKAGHLYLQAGLVHGITPGATYVIYASDVPGPSNPPLTTLRVDSVEPFVSRLKDVNVSNLPDFCYGCRVDYGANQALDVHITQMFIDAAKPSDAWARLFMGDEDDLVLRPVEPELASVIISVNSKKQATFTLRNQALTEHGLETLPRPSYCPIPPNAQRVAPILRALSHWSWHLNRVPDSRPFLKTIDFEFYSFDGNNLNADGVVDIVANANDWYGIKIVNRSSRDLYAYLLDFSGQSLSVEQKTTPSVGSNSSDPTLPRNVPLTIGYGSGGQDPLMFGVPEGQDIDINFFKLFVATSPTDFQSLEQVSPFEGRTTGPDSKVMQRFGESAQWDTFTMVIKQRRYPKESVIRPNCSMVDEIRAHIQTLNYSG